MTTIAVAETEPAEQHTEHPHVTRVKGVAVVSGSRIAVRLIAQMYRAGDSIEDILRTYPHLNASAVHDAISYYLDHLPEIEQEIASHRIESVLKRQGAQLDERGFVSFKPAQANG